MDSATLNIGVTKLDEFAKHKGQLHDELSAAQIRHLTNGATIGSSVKKRPHVQNGDVDTGADGVDALAVAPVTTSKTAPAEEQKVYKWDLVWSNIIVIGMLHLFGLYGFYIRLVTPNLTTFPAYMAKVWAILSSIGVTAGAHRLWTHKSYKANTALQCLLMFMVTMTYQNSVYQWTRDHRLHHKCSETDGDPHNAKRGFFFSHVGWLMVRKHPEVREQGKTIDMSDLEANPIVMFQHKYYYFLVFLCALFIPFATAIYWNIPWHEAFFGCVCYRYVITINITWSINSVAHLYGQRPYDKNIGPTEATFMRYFSFGEGFHNYHHIFPWDYKAAEFGTDARNITTWFIDFFVWLGWATDLRVASADVIEKRCERSGGPGRETHMMKHHPDRVYHNMFSFVLTCFLVYII